jgi:hypothetical protein
MRLLGGGLTINNDDAAPTVDGGRDNYLLGSQLLGYAFLDGRQIYRTKSQTPLQTTPRILLRACWMNAVCRS